jgi:thiol-disulfide isomerase/thioredoxin
MTQRSPRQRLIALAGIVAIVGIAVLLLWVGGVLGNQSGGEGIEDVEVMDPPRAPGEEDLDVGSRPGDLAPDFEISDFDGSRHRLSDFRGQVVYVNFWATWCVPCQEELPDLAYLADEYGDDLAVITVNRTEPLDRARSYLEDLPLLDGGTGADFTVNGMDPNDALFDRYRATAMPSSYVIDADGVVTLAYLGQLHLEDMREAVDEALAGS